jgi:hypothetical protein
MTVMVKVEVKEKRRGRKEDMEQRRGDSGSGQWRNASWAVGYTMALFITKLDHLPPLPPSFQCNECYSALCYSPGAELLDEIQINVLRVFLLAIQSHLYSLDLRFQFLELTQPLTYFYSSDTVHCNG